MRILICGSRTWNDSRAIAARIMVLPRGTIIVHGGARGVDSLAGVIAETLGYATDVYPVTSADWRRYGRQAGMRRNKLMLDSKPDRVLAFWNRVSPGTRHMITEARRRGIPLDVVCE